MASLAPPPSGALRRGRRPSFSVIIATYERAHLVGDAVQSALDQVPPPREVVVCDDGSTDDIEGALASFAERVRLVRIEHRGEAAAKNAAARDATGDFIVILDADDVFLPGRLEAIGELAAQRPDLDLITTDAYLEAGGRIIGRCYHAGHRFAANDQRVAILRGNFVFGLAAVRRSRFLDLGGFDESISHNTDWDCWIRLVLAGGRLGLVDAPLAKYRVHPAAMSADRLSMYRGRVETLRKAAGYPELTADERDVVMQRVAQEEARVDREELRAALVDHDADTRRAAWRVVRNGNQGLRARLKATGAFVVPRAFGAMVRRRDDETWTGVGDIRLPKT
jgi:glycosyltransferase involved in cell wall biosynthesis